MRPIALAVALVAFASTARAADLKVKIAVMDLTAKGVPTDLAQSVSGIVAQELDSLGVFKIISGQDIANMLRFEKTRQAIGCDADSGCMSELGGALGVEYLVAGSLGKLSDTWVLNLTLANVTKGSVEGRVTENVVGKEDKLIGAVKKNARILVSKVLEGREGWLILNTPEVGATVKVDGAAKGVTPLGQRLQLAWGPHLLEVEKTGFVTYQEDIAIPAKQPLVKQVLLVPSPDFLSAYESSARKFRLGAWIATGAAVLGAGTAVAFNYLSGQQEAKIHDPGGYFDKLSAGDESVRSAAEAAANTGNNDVLIARVTGGVAVVGAALGTYFFIAGDDPDKYEKFR